MGKSKTKNVRENGRAEFVGYAQASNPQLDWTEALFQIGTFEINNNNYTNSPEM